MSEYIVDLASAVTKTTEGLTASEAFHTLLGLPVLERITRCKDCKHYDLDGMYKGCCVLRLHTVSGYDPYGDGCYENDVGMYDMPEEGFCSNAERRQTC